MKIRIGLAAAVFLMTASAAMADTALPGNIAYGEGANIPTQTDTTAYGVNATANAFQSTAYGASASAMASQSTAVGAGAVVQGLDSTAVGSGAIVNGANSVSVGGYTVNGEDTVAIGNMSSPIYIVTGDRSVAVGGDTLVTGNQATATGYRSNATNTATSAYGYNSSATNSGATALGAFSNASGSSSIAIGSATSTSGGSIAIGTNASATRSAAIAIGTSSTAASFSSTAIGISATVESGADASMAIGNNALVTSGAVNSVAIGVGSGVSGVNSVALGGGTWATQDNTVAVGNRRIVGVADGVADTDAVNVRQLNQAVTDALGGAVGDINRRISDGVDSAKKYAAQGVAAAMAVPTVTFASNEDTKAVGVNLAHYGGEMALGVAGAVKLTPSLAFQAGFASPLSSGGSVAVRGGLSYSWK